jgi:hypothetical protein
MAKAHRKAGRCIQIHSSLAPDRLAGLCKQAGQQGKLQIDAVEQGRIAFSVRGRITDRIHLMSFEIRLTANDGRQVLTSRITHYKTRQKKLFVLIPVEPKRMIGLPSYEKFMQRLGDLVRSTDPQATIEITG